MKKISRFLMILFILMFLLTIILILKIVLFTKLRPLSNGKNATIDVYFPQTGDLIYVSETINLKKDLSHLDELEVLSLYFTMPLRENKNVVKENNSGLTNLNISSKAKYEYKTIANKLEIKIYKNDFNVFIEDLKNNNYNLFLSYNLPIRNVVGKIDHELFFLIEDDITKPKIKIYIQGDTKKFIDISEMKIGTDDSSLSFEEWDENNESIILNRRLLLLVLPWCLIIEAILLLPLVIVSINNNLIIKKEEIVDNVNTLMEPYLIESIVDEKINSINLITTCIIKLVSKGNIENLDNNRLTLLNTSNINNVEKEIIKLLFLDGTENISLKECVGTTIKISDINNRIKNNREFSEAFYAKMKQIKVIIKEELVEKKIINPFWIPLLRIIRPIAIYFAFMLLLFISVLSHAGILIGSFGLFFIGAILVLSGYKISNHYFALSIIETATVVGFLLFTYFAFARIDYLFILFGIVAIILVLIINEANIYVFTKKGREEYKKVRIFKKFIKNYSLIKNRDIDGVIVYDDYLVYASALGIMSTVTEKISQNLVNYNTILH